MKPIIYPTAKVSTTNIKAVPSAKGCITTPTLRKCNDIIKLIHHCAIPKATKTDQITCIKAANVPKINPDLFLFRISLMK
ncbi:hypothetical protein J4229_00800 [Candidatus Pacearchaeota archaeon]|nr:hypothetical protein [Candidatus Pacearchaeota archaeon]